VRRVPLPRRQARKVVSVVVNVQCAERPDSGEDSPSRNSCQFFRMGHCSKIAPRNSDAERSVLFSRALSYALVEIVCWRLPRPDHLCPVNRDQQGIGHRVPQSQPSGPRRWAVSWSIFNGQNDLILVRTRRAATLATDRGLSHQFRCTLKSDILNHGSNCQFPVRIGSL
jgi:hypothetical protein